MDVLDQIEGIETVEQAAAWAAEACMEIQALRAVMSRVASIEFDWQAGFERSDVAMEQISQALLRGNQQPRKH